jgi:hypothetical protein
MKLRSNVLLGQMSFQLNVIFGQLIFGQITITWSEKKNKIKIKRWLFLFNSVLMEFFFILVTQIFILSKVFIRYLWCQKIRDIISSYHMFLKYFLSWKKYFFYPK